MMGELSSYLPGTVIAAVALFCIKELAEWCRRRSALKRQLKVLKWTLARDCVGAIKSLRQISEALQRVKEVIDEGGKSFEYHFCKNEWGQYFFIFKSIDNEGSIFTQKMMRPIDLKVFEKKLVEAAALDEGITIALEKTYESLIGADHVFFQLLGKYDLENGIQIRHLMRGFHEYAEAVIAGALLNVQGLHVACSPDNKSLNK